MAFLDNSGDIILDAVLTDLGRERLARGDGSFQIAKFALGDDEINYANYNKSNASGSAYYDLDILQTPVFEAFTNNASTMKSKLISLANPNHLYLPVIQINTGDQSSQQTGSVFVICSTSTTEKSTTNSGIKHTNGQNKGILDGVGLGSNGNYIRFDQGLDTTAISPSTPLSNELTETQYSLEVDDRLGYIASPSSAAKASLSYVDDDFIATYIVNAGTEFVDTNTSQNSDDPGQAISGPRGSYLKFRVGAQMNLQQSDYYFDTFGGTDTFNGQSVKYIDSVVRITGMTTGYSADTTIRFMKVT